MSDQASLFKETSSETPTTTGGSTPNLSPTTDELTTLLLQVKNENGEPKYKSVKDALIGLQHAQTHIQTLLSEKRTVDNELNELRPVATKVTELEKLVNQLTQSTTPATEPVTKGMSEEQVATLVEQTMTRNEQIRIAKQNTNTVVESVKKAFGENAEKAFYDKASELGMDVASFNALAARTPLAVLKLLGIDKNTTPATSSSGASINTTDFTSNTESLIGRNKKVLPVGATHNEILQEASDSKRMLEELNAQGITIDDLTKPSNYFKYLGK